jgi:hypothetical protein
MSEDMERILRIEIPSCYVSTKDPEAWDDFELSNGWSNIGNVMYWQGSIDLSGYAMERKTFYPVTAFTQEAQAYVSFGGSGQSVWYLVSSIPTDVNNLLTQIVYASAPGFIQPSIANVPQDDWTSILFGQYETNLINTTLPALGICQPILSRQFGSLSPTAADKLYVTKVVLPTTIAGEVGDSLSIPSSRIVIPGTIREEPKLEYMMRLKRSYELANQV